MLVKNNSVNNIWQYVPQTGLWYFFFCSFLSFCSCFIGLRSWLCNSHSNTSSFKGILETTVLLEDQVATKFYLSTDVLKCCISTSKKVAYPPLIFLDSCDGVLWIKKLSPFYLQYIPILVSFDHSTLLQKSLVITCKVMLALSCQF